MGDPRSVSFNLLDRLKAAHAQQIPDLEAELREVLGSMGYDLVARSPFVEQNSDTKTPINLCQEDMTDWRNWREGDLLLCLTGLDDGLRDGDSYEIVKCGHMLCIVDDEGCVRRVKFHAERFRFHSRPAKGE